MPQTLPSKEQNLFRQVVKYYEAKQYKKAIKAADQVLKKAPNHADTQAFKALTLERQGHTDEAFALAKLALKNDTKSHICWHVYGLLYRAVKNLEEAVKAYKFALRLEPESQQILRDLAFLQIQMRDYQGYIQSRRQMLNARPQVRQNWTGLAVAHHLAGDLPAALKLLETYEGTLKSQPPRTDVEHSEACLYRNTIIAETGDIEEALKHLESISKRNLDRTTIMELHAEYLLRLGRKEEANKAYRALIDRNNEYRFYYEQLEKALDLSRTDPNDLEKILALYQSYSEKSERADASRRIPLDLLTGDEFRTAADHYLRRMLNKGVPSTFANVKSLYRDPTKQAVIHELVESYLTEPREANGSAGAEGSKKDTSKRFLQSVHFFLAQHYNYYLSRDLTKATQHIDQAIEVDSDSVDYTMTKARILKHHGDLAKAAETMDAARKLDERDRYINTKCAKYQLRNNLNEEALSTMSKFTRNETTGGPLGDLHEMQCMWFLYEDGESYVRQGKLALALKRFTAIAKIFDDWQEDQFDFHSFSLRKGQVRAYVEMIRWEDHLRDHPFFTRAALSATRIYIMLYDNPSIAKAGGNVAITNGVANSADANNLDKKALKKAKKEQEKADRAEQAKKDEETKKNPNKKASGGEGDVKKEDPDPKGIKLVQTEKPLEDALRFLQPMLDFSPKNVEAQCLGVDVFLRQKKLLLALKCIHAAHSVDPDSPRLREQIVRYRQALDASPPAADSKAYAVLKAVNPDDSIIPASSSLTTWNGEYLEKHQATHDPQQVQGGLKIRHLLDPGSKSKNEQELLATLDFEKTTLADASAGLSLLQEWNSGTDTRSAYLGAAKKRWPSATSFGHD